MVEHTVGIAIQRDGSIFMSHNIGNGFDIHSALNGTGGEGMAKSVEV